jgi:hypothetical protein
MFECYAGRGAAAQVHLRGIDYQVNVMVGDRASSSRIADALRVARSFTPVGVARSETPRAAFAPSPGWRGGSTTDPTAGGQAFTWTSTTRFRDAPFSFPPIETLRAMTPDDLLIEVNLAKPIGSGGLPTRLPLPIIVDGAKPSQDYPGAVPGRWFQRFLGTVDGGRVLDVWVFAGQQPSKTQAARLQQRINSMVIPRPGTADARHVHSQ